MAFLNETGLATFLSYLKAWARATFASKTDSQTIEGATTFSQTVTGSITGNAGSATQLKTARTINGVPFDGSANITVADSTKVSKTGNEVVAGKKTFTDQILLNTGSNSFQKGIFSSQSNGVKVSSEAFSGSSSGAYLDLNGRSASSSAGCFGLCANSSAGSKLLHGKPDGTLTWDNKDITGDVHTTGNENIGGVKTFTDYLTVLKSTPILNLRNTGTSGSYCDIRLITYDNNTTTAIRDNYNGNFSIGHTYQGGAWNSGASLEFYYSSGNFALSACAGASGTRRSLIGESGGTLKWNGQTVQTTSDERLKTPLSEVPDAVLDAWEDVNWGQFQYLDAVKAKGESARLHLGLIAQRVIAAFKDRGLDACEYGILCYEAEEDLWMVRYMEALAMEAACQRRRADRLEARIKALEEAHA